MLDYLGRDTHRVAISNERLVSLDGGRVRFRWKDYREPQRPKTMTLPAEEFIRRFLLHLVPPGFHRIRHFGFLANCHRRRKLQLCRRLLCMPQPQPPGEYRDRHEALTGESLRRCPACGRGEMVTVERVPRAGAAPEPEDTS